MSGLIAACWLFYLIPVLVDQASTASLLQSERGKQALQIAQEQAARHPNVLEVERVLSARDAGRSILIQFSAVYRPEGGNFQRGTLSSRLDTATQPWAVTFASETPAE